MNRATYSCIPEGDSKQRTEVPLWGYFSQISN